MIYLFSIWIGLNLSVLSYADTQFSPPPLKLEPLATFKVQLNAPVWELGKTADMGQRRIIPITGGTFLKVLHLEDVFSTMAQTGKS